MVAKSGKTLAETAAASAKAAEASSELVALLGPGLVAQEPQSLEACADFTAQDGSSVKDKARFLALATAFRTHAQSLGEAFIIKKREGPLAAAVIAAMRRTVTTPGGATGPDKVDYFGDSYIWKTYVSRMLKAEMVATFGQDAADDIWNNATNYYAGRDLIVLVGIIDDNIASGVIPEEDAAIYHALMASNGMNLGDVRKNNVEQIPQSIVDLCNSAIDRSAQKRDGWKLVKKAPQTREAKLKADPAKTVKEATEMLELVATVDAPSGGAKYAPLPSWEAYYKTTSQLIRSQIIGTDGKPRKGGIGQKPQVKAVMEQLRDAVNGYLLYDDGQIEFDTLVELLYSDNAAAKS